MTWPWISRAAFIWEILRAQIVLCVLSRIQLTTTKKKSSKLAIAGLLMYQQIPMLSRFQHKYRKQKMTHKFKARLSVFAKLNLFALRIVTQKGIEANFVFSLFLVLDIWTNSLWEILPSNFPDKVGHFLNGKNQLCCPTSRPHSILPNLYRALTQSNPKFARCPCTSFRSRRHVTLYHLLSSHCPSVIKPGVPGEYWALYVRVRCVFGSCLMYHDQLLKDRSYRAKAKHFLIIVAYSLIIFVDSLTIFLFALCELAQKGSVPLSSEIPAFLMNPWIELSEAADVKKHVKEKKIPFFEFFQFFPRISHSTAKNEGCLSHWNLVAPSKNENERTFLHSLLPRPTFSDWEWHH